MKDVDARVYLAGCALQGHLSDPNAGPVSGESRDQFVASVAASAVEFADAVLRSLKLTPPLAPEGRGDAR